MKKILIITAIAALGAESILAAPFTPGNLALYRVGDGAAALSNAATAVFIDEYTTTGTLVQSVPLPTAVTGSNKRLTASGTATSEGLMTLSADGRYLMLSGYDADVGTAAVAGTASTAVNRVVARVDASAAIDSTTALSDAYSGGTANIRGAASTDGTNIWTTGTGTSAGTSGSRHTTLGSTTSVQLSTTVTNLRGTNIFGGQLYVSAGLAAFRLGTVGTGTPMDPGQTITSLPGFPTATGGTPSSPYQFFFADLDSGVAGVDTVYVTDDTGASAGVQKYSLVGGSWTANGVVALTGTRGVTGIVSGSSVALYVTNGSTFQTLTDTSGYNVTINGALSSLATATTNTAFRGIAFVPAATGAPIPTGAVSRKTHGAAGTFEVALPLSGTPGIECRTGGSTNDYTMVVTFGSPVTVNGTPQAQVVSGTGTIGTGGVSNGGMVTISGNDVTVPLTNVTNAQTIQVRLNNVTGTAGSGNVTIPMSVLIADTNANAAVNSGDVAQAKARLGAALDTTNFRSDVNVNGAINAGDVSLVKSLLGTGLP